MEHTPCYSFLIVSRYYPMGFHIHTQDLTQAVAAGIRDVCRDLFSGPAPKELHHYTRGDVVRSIIETRSVWATCVDGHTADKGEISHATALVAESAAEVSRSPISQFAADVLNRLPHFMEERRKWAFITCFCDDDESRTHFERFGPYRLTFAAPWMGGEFLGLEDSSAECWYQRVVYCEERQRAAVERALQSIVSAVSLHTGGDNRGPMASWMIDSCARIAGQLLLAMGLGFKPKRFDDEREWRVICCPRLGHNTSAPPFADENFATNVRNSTRRRVLLRVKGPWRIFEPVVMAPIPFLRWGCDLTRTSAVEASSIEALLRRFSIARAV
jgi:hypothetical protein